MSFRHIVEVPEGVAMSNEDRVVLGNALAVANAAGAGAGASVATPVEMDCPNEYNVLVDPGQGCGWYISNKSTAGFTVNLVPFAGTDTIAAGSFNVTLVG